VFDEVHINNLAVAPAHRGRGYGTELLRHALAEGRRLGARRATLEVRQSNLAAQRLYARLGFRVAGRRPAYYTHPVEDAFILWRDTLDP
jgi:[ribosomal protein S18]-alanine N-acetyltransferase